MSMTIELPPELEAGLAAQAKAQGVPLPDFVRQVLEERALATASGALSPALRVAAWRASVAGLPHTPPLSDEAISREAIYDVRG